MLLISIRRIQQTRLLIFFRVISNKRHRRIGRGIPYPKETQNTAFRTIAAMVKGFVRHWKNIAQNQHSSNRIFLL